MGNCCTWKSGLEGAGEMQMRAQAIPFYSISPILNHEFHQICSKFLHF